MTQQESDRLKTSSRENGTVGVYLLSESRSTRSTEHDGEEIARVSDTAGTVADGERKELLDSGSRSTSRGNYGDGEAERD